MERKVVKKALLYLFNFLVTWPMVICVMFYRSAVQERSNWDLERDRGLYWLYLTALTLAPLQGAFNSLVYFYNQRGAGAARRRDRQRASIRRRERSTPTLYGSGSSVRNLPRNAIPRCNSDGNGGSADDDLLDGAKGKDSRMLAAFSSIAGQDGDPLMTIAQAPPREHVTRGRVEELRQYSESRIMDTSRRSRSQSGLARPGATVVQRRLPFTDSQRSKSLNAILSKLNIWAGVEEKEESAQSPAIADEEQDGELEADIARDDDDSISKSETVLGPIEDASEG
mmetsp:Transcript_23865/g.35301  ORF Transcript_23865/g.35301 Transcript_23865/m.35301 type:complete len:283 (-) Transcript_23865:512-1360(-)